MITVDRTRNFIDALITNRLADLSKQDPEGYLCIGNTEEEAYTITNLKARLKENKVVVLTLNAVRKYTRDAMEQNDLVIAAVGNYSFLKGRMECFVLIDKGCEAKPDYKTIRNHARRFLNRLFDELVKTFENYLQVPSVGKGIVFKARIKASEYDALKALYDGAIKYDSNKDVVQVFNSLILPTILDAFIPLFKRIGTIPMNALSEKTTYFHLPFKLEAWLDFPEKSYILNPTQIETLRSAVLDILGPEISMHANLSKPIKPEQHVSLRTSISASVCRRTYQRRNQLNIHSFKILGIPVELRLGEQFISSKDKCLEEYLNLLTKRIKYKLETSYSADGADWGALMVKLHEGGTPALGNSDVGSSDNDQPKAGVQTSNASKAADQMPDQGWSFVTAPGMVPARKNNDDSIRSGALRYIEKRSICRDQGSIIHTLIKEDRLTLTSSEMTTLETALIPLGIMPTLYVEGSQFRYRLTKDEVKEITLKVLWGLIC